MRLGDLDALKEIFLQDRCGNIFLPKHFVISTIDNAPTVKTYCYFCGQTEHGQCEERPQGECRTCIHRDPEDKKCDCGGIERQGCPFPVSDDYFCKFYEKGGAK